MRKKCSLWIMAVILLLPLSCSSPAKIGYLRDMEYYVPMQAQPAPELKLKVDDRISIQVFSEEPELAAPFNASVSGSKESAAGSLLSSTYGVDPFGNIDFPVLGTIHVEGKTINQVKKEMAAEIIRRGYIKEPVIKIELENFTVTIVGETATSVMPVDGGSINILQVIAASGGTEEKAKIPDIMVVRTENGQRMAYTINLQSKDLFDSPVFWLQQNDLVYVKPRGLRLSTGGDLFLKIFSPAIAAVSSVAYMLLWTAR